MPAKLIEVPAFVVRTLSFFPSFFEPLTTLPLPSVTLPQVFYTPPRPTYAMYTKRQD